MKIYLVRHGETDKNTTGYTHIKGDTEQLNNMGREQASSLARSLVGRGIIKVFTSPEHRAVETAQIIADKLNIDVEIEDELHERNMGDLNGKPWSEIESVLNKMNISERYTFIPPSGESWQQMEIRLLSTLNKLKDLDAGGNLLVVTHAGAIRGLMPAIKQEPLETSFAYDFGNTSVTILEAKDSGFKVILENDTSHLRTAGSTG